MGITLLSRPVWVAFVAIVAFVCLTSPAQAESRVDWQRGLLIGTGASAGDLRSPNRQLARVKAERQARKRCRQQIFAAAEHVARAGAGNGASAKAGTNTSAGASAQKRAKFESFAKNLITLHTDFGSDGSVVVEMALPLDTLRAFVFGADSPAVVGSDSSAVDGTDSPDVSTLGHVPALVIDARKLKFRPAIGYQLDDGTNQYRGPTLFFTTLKQVKDHSGIGEVATVVVAAKMSKGVISVPKGTLVSAADRRPLITILWSEKK